jgi:hypothetical protein
MTGSGEVPQEPRERAPERPPESASFEAVRVGSRRGQAPIALLAFLVVLAAFVAVGVGGRSSPAATPVDPAAVATASVQPSTAAPTPGRPTHGPDPTPFLAAMMTSGPGPLRLEVQRNVAALFVHGDVFVPRVTWVYVSLVDDAGNVAGWASVSVPGTAGPGLGGGPTLRFDVELAIPTGFDGRLWISATAYDDSGTRVAGAQIEAGALTRSELQLEP